ncbi:MAG: ribonuclease HI family protein [Deltaproteobacteria bacterium]|nr:ribonuclease HI family protein [Deltaproteobacteria bacterium]
MTRGPGLDNAARARIFTALARGMDLDEVLRRFNLAPDDLKALFREAAELYRIREEGCWRLFCDGASRGNPGPAGAGALLQDPAGHLQAQASRYLGQTTNNVAEYQALLLGLELARKRGVRRLQIFLDSQLVTEQLNGRYQVKSARLRPLWQQARQELQKFDFFAVKHIERTLNTAADRLANEAIDRAPKRR